MDRLYLEHKRKKTSKTKTKDTKIMYKLKELQTLTIRQGQYGDLKIETDRSRVWLSGNHVTLEKLIDVTVGKWVVTKQYKAK